MGFPELGYVSLHELTSLRLPMGLSIERDLHFRPKQPLSVYTTAARAEGRIVEHGPALDTAALPLEERDAIAAFNEADPEALAPHSLSTAGV